MSSHSLPEFSGGLARALVAILVVVLAGAARLRAERLDRENLLRYHISPSEVAPARTVDEWKHRRSEICAGMQAVLGALPGPEKRVALDVRIERETDCGSYIRKEISYISEPNARVPAFLLVPKAVLDGKTRRPGILCLMPTNHYAGVRAVVGLDETNIPRRAKNPIKPGRNYGEELALRGYVVIAPAYPLLADYRPDLKALGYQSGMMKAVWDNIRALDVLAALPGVTSGGVGAIGFSLGGYNAMFTAAYDERITVVVSSCGFDSFLDYAGAGGPEASWKPGKGWAQALHFPRILNYPRAEIPFDFHELAGVLAPRAFLAIAPRRDKYFKWESAARVVKAARPIYELYGASERLVIEHPDCEHDFPPEMRDLAYRWLDRFLNFEESR